MQEAAFGAAQVTAWLEVAAALVAVAILLSSLDDLFIDLWYWCRRAGRWWTLERTGQLRPLTAAQLVERAEQPMAIMVPAWKEHNVIASMVENMVRVLDYQQYVVFIGTYVNDAATIAEVDRMCRRYRQVRRVDVPHPGPTCKADCLNFVVEAIFAHERACGTEFAGVVLHDSEDVLHPLELRFFNYLLPRKDMIQLPVASLERRLDEWVAGTYMDEFAESHGKEMHVRESLAGTVPSAGVGTCFSRRALSALVGATRNHPFNTDSLTEDYDVGMRLQALGMHSIFAVFPVEYRVRARDWRGHDYERQLRAPLSVREFFPDNLRAAYRQKARWVLGIGLQSWQQIPWRGRSPALRYLLLHDRKGVVTSFVSILAYALLLAFGLLQLGATRGWWPAVQPRLFTPGSGWIALVELNMLFLVNRALHRYHFTSRLYGWRHGMASLPRMVVGNVVNCLAVGRAWHLYIAHLVLGRRLVWDKTAHEFPTAGELVRDRQRLGELLTSWQAVDADRLSQALREQQGSGLPLGRVLVVNGWLDEETLAEAIAFQADLPRAQLSAELVSRHASAMPAGAALRLRAVCIGPNAAGAPVLAVAAPLDAQGLAEAATHLGQVPLQRIARDGEIDESLALVAAAAGEAPPARESVLGDLLVQLGLLDRPTWEAALRDWRPERHGRIGDFLVERGVIVRGVLEQAVQQRRGPSGSSWSLS